MLVTHDMGAQYADDPDRLFELAKSEASQLLPDLKRLDDTELDGETAIAFTGTMYGDRNGLTQVAAVHDDDIYVLSIAYSKDTSDSEQKNLVNSITSSWNWA